MIVIEDTLMVERSVVDLNRRVLLLGWSGGKRRQLDGKVRGPPPCIGAFLQNVNDRAGSASEILADAPALAALDDLNADWRGHLYDMLLCSIQKESVVSVLYSAVR